MYHVSYYGCVHPHELLRDAASVKSQPLPRLRMTTCLCLCVRALAQPGPAMTSRKVNFREAGRRQRLRFSQASRLEMRVGVFRLLYLNRGMVACIDECTIQSIRAGSKLNEVEPCAQTHQTVKLPLLSNVKDVKCETHSTSEPRFLDPDIRLLEPILTTSRLMRTAPLDCFSNSIASIALTARGDTYNGQLELSGNESLQDPQKLSKAFECGRPWVL